MPSTYNGIGSWYYGKRRVHRLKATCPHCHRIGELESYDTTLYFVFLMIPIIPLKKKRVLESCPFCLMHRVIDLNQWEAGKEKAIADVLEKLRQDPDDREVILEALGMSTFFQDQPLFEKLATLAVDKTGDAQIQAGLAAGYSYFSQRDKAIEAYKHSLIADDNPQVRRDLAINFLRMGDPEQAEPLLRHVWETPDAAGIGHVQLLIEAYRSEGKHDQALNVMDLRDAAFPEFAQNKDVKEQRRNSEKYRKSGKAIRSAASLADTQKSGYKEGSKMGSGLAKWIFPLILLGLFATYVGVAIYKGNNRKIYLVNGTKKAYSVEVNGAEKKLPPEQATPVYVPEGDVEVKVPGLPIEPIHCKVATDFWGRPFNGAVFVINPDRSACLFDQTIIYAVNPPIPPDPTYHFGKEFYQFPGIDYQFEQPPREIQLKRGVEVKKTQLQIDRTLDPMGRVQFLMGKVANAGERVGVLKRMIDFEPGEAIYLSVLLNQLTSEEGFNYLKTGLSKRPLLVEWHRLYQTFSEQKRPEFDLIAEYEALLTETKSPDAMYLLARVIHDHERALKLVTEGSQADPPSLYAQYALGYYALVQGRFDEAVEWLGKAYEKAPSTTVFLRFYRDALWAAKKYDLLMGLPSAAGSQPILNQLEHLRIVAAKGDRQQFEQLKPQILTQLGTAGMGDPENMQKFRRGIDILMPVTQGDVKGVLKVYSGEKSDKPHAILLLEGKFQEAANANQAFVREVQASGARDENNIILGTALVYLYARRDGLKEIADKQFELLLELIPKKGAEERILTEMLSGKRPFDLKNVLASHSEPEIKRALLRVFADRFPEAKNQLLELATKLDFQRDISSLALRQLDAKK